MRGSPGYRLAWLVLPVVALYALSLQADTRKEIDALLARQTPPEGVVFEIVSSNEDTLEWAIPVVQRYSQQLRERFPGINLAVVSHGMEQFALTRESSKEYAEVHKGVESLVKTDVPVHVCSTFAGWHGVKDEDFAEFVDVAPTGPSQIQLYEHEGYITVRVRKE
jgi:intracellular sulfur oxidation DsrE/DsrF family protein